MFSKKLLIPMLVVLSTLCSVPVLAANAPNHESRSEVSHFEHGSTMPQPQANNRFSPAAPARHEQQQFPQLVRRENQPMPNQSRPENRQFSNPREAMDGFHASAMQSPVNPMEREHQEYRHDDRGGYASYQPVAPYVGWVPVISSGTVDPRNWETSLEQAIYADRDAGLTSPMQAQSRLNEVTQIREEHQQYLNQNGAPNGNVLTPAEIDLIHSQLNAVNQERMADCGNRGTYLQLI
jgi:hypothetical protein